MDGFRYYLICVDHFTKYVWLYPMYRKSDVSIIFPKFRAIVENYFKLSTLSVYSDNGGEYVALKNYFTLFGISHFTTPPHTPEHNGTAERRHRHIVETSVTLLHNSYVPLEFWSHAFQTAVYLINRLPTHVLRYSSPLEALFGSHPNYLKLGVFGCQCYPWLKPYNKNKFQAKSKPCIFMGYSTSQSAYKCWDPEHNSFFVSRHVQFIETIFPFLNQAPIAPHDNTISQWSDPMLYPGISTT